MKILFLRTLLVEALRCACRSPIHYKACESITYFALSICDFWFPITVPLRSAARSATPRALRVPPISGHSLHMIADPPSPRPLARLESAGPGLAYGGPAPFIGRRSAFLLAPPGAAKAALGRAAYGFRRISSVRSAIYKNDKKRFFLENRILFYSGHNFE